MDESWTGLFSITARWTKGTATRSLITVFLITQLGLGAPVLSATLGPETNGGADAFHQDRAANGLVSIEAENPAANVSQGAHSWVGVYPAGTSGSGAMASSPNAGTNVNTGYVSSSPRLDYAVEFNHTGTHYVWVLGGPDTSTGRPTSNDSLHVGLDGQAVVSADRISSAGSWKWSNATMDAAVARVNVPSTGRHVVNVWMREDGFIIDKLVLTTDPNYVPTGSGPAESPQTNGTLTAPAINPKAGNFSDRVAVTLTAEPQTVIYYTLNGSSPTRNSTRYQGAFELSTTTTVKALAVATGYIDSTISEATFTVVPKDDTSGAFHQDRAANGLVSIEAENPAANVSQGAHSWVGVYPAGTSGSGAMASSPNAGTNVNTGYVSSSPRLDYAVEFNHTGTHYVWVLGGPDTSTGRPTSNDSLHVGLDGQAVASADRISSAGSWKWSNATMDAAVARVNVPSTGRHVVNVWMREDGFIIDKLVLTTDPNYVPTGSGPAESPQNKGTLTAPAINPKAGNFSDRVAVTLTAEPQAVIYYTLNGSSPTRNSTRYQGAFELSTTTTVKALAVATDYIDSTMSEATFTVVPKDDTSGAFHQDRATNGLVSIEAENPAANVSQGAHSWVGVNPAGTSGSGAMASSPNARTNVNTGYVSSSPRLDYAVEFNHTGTHYVWVLGGPDTSSGTPTGDDSLHVGLDGQAVPSADRISFAGKWKWSNATMDAAVARVNVRSTGRHIVNVWMREDGFIIDKLVLTTDPDYVPTGSGPAESPPHYSTPTAPVLAAIGNRSTTVEELLSLTVVATDDNGAPALIADLSEFPRDNQPTFSTLANGSGTVNGSFRWTPQAIAAGNTYRIRFTATDRVDSRLRDTIEVVIDVAEIEAPLPNYRLLVSQSPDRSGALPLQGRELENLVYVYIDPPQEVKRASFFVDDPGLRGGPYRVESLAPFDLAGGSMSLADSYDLGALRAGSHTVSASVEHSNGETVVISSEFFVIEPARPSRLTLHWTPSEDEIQGYRVLYGNSRQTAIVQISDLSIAEGDVNPVSPSVSYELEGDLGLAASSAACFRVTSYLDQTTSPMSEAVCQQF